jgi:hypothetical protein
MNIKEEKYFIYFKLKMGYVEGETHGLIAAPFDAPTDPTSTYNMGRCRYNTPISGADGTAIGTGAKHA